MMQVVSPEPDIDVEERKKTDWSRPVFMILPRRSIDVYRSRDEGHILHDS